MTSPEPNNREETAPIDWPDRLVEQALRERLGGETPPDLTDQILAAAASLPTTAVDPSSQRNRAMTSETSTREPRGWRLAALAASAAFIAGTLVATAVQTEQRAGNNRLALRERPAGSPIVVSLPAEERGATGEQVTDELRELASRRSGRESELQEEVLPAKKVFFGKTVTNTNGQSAQPVEPTPQPGSGPVAAPLGDVDAEQLEEVRRPYSSSNRGPTPGQTAILSRPYYGASKGAAADFSMPATEGAASTRFQLDDAPRRQALFFAQQPGNDRYGFGADTPRLGLRFRRLDGGGQFDDRLGRERREGRGPGSAGDQYTAIHENPFIEAVGGRAVSTFSIDVDTASYTNVRRMLNSGQLPPPDAVRLEEFINYFDYGYAGPPPVLADESASGKAAPFAAHLHVGDCPWKPEHKIVRVGVQGREVEAAKRPLTNLVFLIDVSGSMNSPDKHPLVIEGLKALASQLGESDRVAIVVYASSEGLALPSTPGDDQETIFAALDSLRAGGSTAGGAGIRLAYRVAEDSFIEGGVNRVILCTDGDFNVGTTSTGDLERLVADKAKATGVFLSVCGFGRGNLNDAMMETITNKGNGAYHYIDSPKEAKRVFVDGLSGTLITIAKDVKIQVEFNPAKIAGYRLLGYENRMLRTQDFNDDKKDAGEIGAGHSVTALYEIVPAGKPVEAPQVDDLKYQQVTRPKKDAATSGELLTLKMRYKQPDGDTSTKLEWPLADPSTHVADMPAGIAARTDFATAVAGFAMLLRNSQHAGDATFAAMEEIAQAAAESLGDEAGRKAELVGLIQKAKQLRGDKPAEKKAAAGSGEE